MADPTSTGGVAIASAATGTLSLPFLAWLGLDAHALMFGLLGCIIVQCLLPDVERKLAQIAMLTTGGTLLAAVLAPVATPHIVDYFGHAVSPQAVHNLTAAAIGGFAQPIVVAARARLSKLLAGTPRPSPAQPEK